MRPVLAQVCLAGVLICSAGATAAAQNATATTQSDTAPPSAVYHPAYEATNGILSSGREVVVYYFGAASCGPCNWPKATQALQRAKMLVKAQAAAHGAQFAVIGVANDWEVDTALGFLRKEGPFDEVIAGRNMLNSAWIEQLWRGSTGVDAMPGIVVIEHDLTIGKQSLTVAPDRVLLAFAGADKLLDWVNRGAPVGVQ